MTPQSERFRSGQSQPGSFTRYTRPARRWYENLIVGLLAVMVLFVLFRSAIGPSRSNQARLTAAQTDLHALSDALIAFKADTGHYPTQTQGLQALIQAPGDAINWHGPYCRLIPSDPWGKPYVYTFPGVHNANAYDLHSRGPDGREGYDDINNW